MILCTMCMQCLQRPEEGIDPLELELQAVRDHVGAVNRTRVLCKSTKCSQLLNHIFTLKTDREIVAPPTPTGWKEDKVKRVKREPSRQNSLKRIAMKILTHYQIQFRNKHHKQDRLILGWKTSLIFRIHFTWSC